MVPVVAPQEDVNSETALLVNWYVEDASYVKKNEPICEVETTKVIFDVVAAADGWLVRGREAGEEIRFNVPIGLIVPHEAEIPAARYHLEEPRSDRTPVAEQNVYPGKITEKARRLIEEHGIQLSQLPVKHLLTERDILPLLDDKDDYFSPLDQRVYPLDRSKTRVQRTLVLGAGLGAMQVVDILAHDPRVQVIGYVDDDSQLHGHTIYGLPVLGPSSLAEEWFKADRCDAAIISVSTSNKVRRRWYEWLKGFGIPLVNAIDPSAKLNRGAMLGEGNVICAFVHVGVETRVGNNNFLSAYTSIDHHNLWGSHITTGPAVVASGLVQVDDDVKMGTGIFIQPHVTIGRGVQIASGAVLTRSVPPFHAAKTRINTELTPLPSSQQRSAATDE